MPNDAPARPGIYLATPPQIELATFPDRLAGVLDAVEIACLRLALATRDEDTISRAADILRDISHARDIPVIIDNHFRLVERLGLDGVHLTSPRHVRDVRKELGKDLVVGAFCGASRHDGMTVAELGADYISFGPVSADSLLGDGQVAEAELFAWWSEMIEIPVVAEGGLTVEAVEALAPVTDFLAFGEDIWATDDPAGALRTLLAPL